jgi:hypothetical protein
MTRLRQFLKRYAPVFRQVFLVFGAFLFITLTFSLCALLFIKNEIESEISRTVEKVEESLAQKIEIHHQNVRLNIVHLGVSVNGITIKTKDGGGEVEEVAIDRLLISGIDVDSLRHMAKTRKPMIPKVIRVSLSDISFKASAFGASMQNFASELGYNDFKISIDSKLKIDNAMNDIEISDMSIDAANMGELEVSAKVENLSLPSSKDFADIKEDPSRVHQVFEKYSGIRLQSFSLQYNDHSLVKRMSTLVSKDGESPVDLIDMTIGELRDPKRNERGLKPKEDLSFAIDALSKLRTFFADPKSISISAHPAKAIALSEMIQDPARGDLTAFAQKLGFKVDAANQRFLFF